MRAAALLLGALALALPVAACISDPHAAPVPGHDVRVYLLPEKAATARWPMPWSRGARFLVENRTGAPVETILVDLGGHGAPRELVEATVEDPEGIPALILPAPVGTWPLRARLGNPGTVLLEPGARLALVLHVEGEPGKASIRFEIPK